MPGPTPLSRRIFTAFLCSGIAAPFAARAGDDVIDLEWSDLMSGEDVLSMDVLRENGITSRDQFSIPEPDWEPTTLAPLPEQPEARGVTTAYDGKTIRLRGYVVPLDYSGTGITQFILVPFVGACIHVPPPPANQLVFVTTERPYEDAGLYVPVTVIGTIRTAATSTQLAEIGYALLSDRIEPYRQ